MDNGNLKIINTLGKSNQRKLLKAFEHRNINDAIKHYGGANKKKYTEQEKQHAYELMRDDYNDIVQNLQKEAKEQKKQERKPKTEYLNTIRKYNTDILPQNKIRSKYVDTNEYRKQNINFEKKLKEFKYK